jgi:hypothetical protein
MALMLTTRSLYAEDITTIKGKIYSDIVVQRVEPDGITIKHTAGFGKLFFSELSPETQQKYGYDPEKHRQYYDAKQIQAANAELIRMLDGIAIDVNAKLSQVLDDGSLAYITVYNTFVYTNDVTDTHAGSRTSYNPLTGGTTKMPSGSQGSVVRSEVKSITSKSEREEPVFIVGLSSGYVDGESWSGRIYPIGTYNYTTVQGAPKKIKKYTLSRSTALKFYGQ